MAKVIEEKPKSLTDFVELVEKYQSTSTESLWFRGCGRATYELKPSLYRHPKKTSISDVAKLEQGLMVRFRQRSIPFQPRPIGDDWDVLFFMQHYRIPTRLLDWTENPLIALHFAVLSAEHTLTTTGKPRFTQQAAVWILNPSVWNRTALAHQSFDGGVLSPGDDALKGYRPHSNFEGMNQFPVAVYGAHNSPRIVAQKGVFTVFGPNTSPMESLYATESFPDNSLVKVVLGQRSLPRLRKAVLDHGVTESAVFPDLEGLAAEIRRNFGFHG